MTKGTYIIHNKNKTKFVFYFRPQDEVEIQEFQDQLVAIEPNDGNVVETFNVASAGRRLVDIGYFFEQIMNIGEHKPFHCNITNMEVTGEVKRGLDSKFTLTCKMCGIKRELCTDSKTGENLKINDAAILGAISTGIGNSQMKELFSTMNVPYMAASTFASSYQNIAEKLHQTAWLVMEQAGNEERSIAIANGDVDLDGIPYITVIVDGAWSKRSYNMNYNAASGVVRDLFCFLNF